MELLKSGVDRAVIELCLGHEFVETTQMYLSTDLDLKKTRSPVLHPGAHVHAATAPGTSLGLFEEPLIIPSVRPVNSPKLDEVHQTSKPLST
ncbi:MAG TPA: hypothetical protein VHN14_13905 [Kofleriaceae bacterium]|jgi:hypothetical protein|nr:hypothetical protein [Kofleriaceae bacterium]